MSDIVRLELRKQFMDEIEEHNRFLKKAIKDAKRLKIDILPNEINIEEHLEKFDNCYKALFSVENFKLLPIKNEFLPDLVDRAIYRKKPFTNEKMEVKDTIIWSTYSKYVESMSLDTFILLTANHSDFCDKKDHSKIHPELLKDTARLKVVKGSYEFTKEYAAVLDSPEHRLQVFLQNTQIDLNYVNDLVHEHFDDLLTQQIREKARALSPSDIMDDEFWYDGYVSEGEIELLQCEKFESEKLTETVLIAGTISALCDVEIFEYNAGRDHGEEQYNSISEKTITFEIHFTFNLSPEEVPSDFECLSVSVVDTN